MMDKLFHDFFVCKKYRKAPRICAMNLKVFNFSCKVHNDIVNVHKNTLQINEPVS